MIAPRLAARAAAEVAEPLAQLRDTVDAAVRDLDDDRRRVLFVCHDFPNVHAGGAQLYARDLAVAVNRLQARWRVDVVYPQFRQSADRIRIDPQWHAGLRLHELVKERAYRLGPGAVEHPIVEDLIDDLLRRERYDVVHVHGLGELSVSPLLAVQRHGLPTVATLHDFWFMCANWFLTNSAGLCSGPETQEKCARCLVADHVAPEAGERTLTSVRQLMARRQPLLLEAFDAIDRKFAPSQYVVDRYAQYGYYGIEAQPLGLVPPARVEPKTTRPGGVTFGFLGNIVERKGVSLLVDAFTALEAGDDVRLHLWGKSQSAELGRLVRCLERDDRRVEWHGPYERDDIPRILSQVDVVVVPSLWESFSIVVREAFQHRTPVIAAHTGGMREAFEHGRESLFFEPGDESRLVAQMQAVVDDPGLVSRLAARIGPVRSIEDDAGFYLRQYEELATLFAPAGG